MAPTAECPFGGGERSFADVRANGEVAPEADASIFSKVRGIVKAPSG